MQRISAMPYTSGTPAAFPASPGKAESAMVRPRPVPTDLASISASTSPTTHGRHTAANQLGGLFQMGSGEEEEARKPRPMSATPATCPAALMRPRCEGSRAPTHSPSPTAATTLTTERSSTLQSRATSVRYLEVRLRRGWSWGETGRVDGGAKACGRQPSGRAERRLSYRRRRRHCT
eukprot:scaffold33273_cov62-Phaeocystis_antarctica.AAC.5